MVVHLRDDSCGHGGIKDMDKLEIILFSTPKSADLLGIQALVSMILGENSNKVSSVTINGDTMTVNGHREFLRKIFEVLEDIPGWLETPLDSELVVRFLMNEELWTAWLRELPLRISRTDLLEVKQQAAPWGKKGRTGFTTAA